MISSVMLYWFFTVYHVVNFLIGISVVALVLSFICFIAGIPSWDEGGSCWNSFKKTWLPKIIKTIAVSLIVLFITLFIPSKKEMAMIYVIPKIAQNKDVQEIPANIVKLANEGLKELIDTVKKDVENKVTE